MHSKLIKCVPSSQQGRIIEYPFIQSFILMFLLSADIGCLNIHGTHVTANNYTNNNVAFFASDLKKSIQ